MKRGNLDCKGSYLAELETLDRDALAERWTDVYGHPAPLRAHAQLLMSGLAGRYQFDHEANVEVDRLLRRLRRQAAVFTPVVASSPGTRLLR